MSKLITWDTPGTSRPRAATSEATRMVMSPCLKRSSSRMRSLCSMSPWICPTGMRARFSTSARSRTIVFLLQKMMAVFTSSWARNERTRSFFSRFDVSTTHWVMLVLVLAALATSMLFGLSMNWSASFLIGGGMVAENSRVCRDFGSLEQMVSISGMKPMSSMRSASSITSMAQPDIKILPRFIRSIRRPGVAISTSTPFSSAAS